MTKSTIELKSQLLQSAAQVEEILTEKLNNCSIQKRLLEAMRYSLLNGGKRLRAVIALWTCQMIAGQVNENAEIAAAALEMVHCYSLIHDDLPAMDDDDFRRGKASCHKAFDQATAILAGDSLLTYAFEILTQAKPADCACEMIKKLALAAGPAGMVAGQMADIQAENCPPEISTLEYIHINKTAAMFRASAEMGAIAGGGNETQIAAVSQFGMKMGLCFQIADDILDVSATSEQMGKTVGKDAIQGKMTYPSLMGLEKANQLKEALAEESIKQLDIFGNKAELLVLLIKFLLERTS